MVAVLLSQLARRSRRLHHGTFHPYTWLVAGRSAGISRQSAQRIRHEEDTRIYERVSHDNTTAYRINSNDSRAALLYGALSHYTRSSSHLDTRRVWGTQALSAPPLAAITSPTSHHQHTLPSPLPTHLLTSHPLLPQPLLPTIQPLHLPPPGTSILDPQHSSARAQPLLHILHSHVRTRTGCRCNSPCQRTRIRFVSEGKR